MGRAEGPAHFLEAQRLFENDGTPYFVSLARGTKLFFNMLHKYGTPLPYYCTSLNIIVWLHNEDKSHRRLLGGRRGSALSVPVIWQCIMVYM